MTENGKEKKQIPGATGVLRHWLMASRQTSRSNRWSDGPSVAIAILPLVRCDLKMAPTTLLSSAGRSWLARIGIGARFPLPTRYLTGIGADDGQRPSQSHNPPPPNKIAEWSKWHRYPQTPSIATSQRLLYSPCANAMDSKNCS